MRKSAFVAFALLVSACTFMPEAELRHNLDQAMQKMADDSAPWEATEFPPNLESKGSYSMVLRLPALKENANASPKMVIEAQLTPDQKAIVHYQLFGDDGKLVGIVAIQADGCFRGYHVECTDLSRNEWLLVYNRALDFAKKHGAKI